MAAPTDRNQTSHIDQTEALSPPDVARYVQQVFTEAGDVTPEDNEGMIQLFDRDINRVDADRYETPLMFVLPSAIYAGNRSSITDHISGAIAAGHPLTLSLHSLATRIIFDEQSDGKPKAVGIEYLEGEGLYSADSRYNSSSTGQLKTVKAKREVIVSGGTFNTPQVLKLSGVGPREELEALDIPVMVDLPAVVSQWDNKTGNSSTNRLRRATSCKTTTKRQFKFARRNPGWTSRHPHVLALSTKTILVSSGGSRTALVHTPGPADLSS